MTLYSYIMICKMIDHYEDLYRNATSIEQRSIAREGLFMYRKMWEAYNN